MWFYKCLVSYSDFKVVRWARKRPYDWADPGTAKGVFCLKKYNWHKRLIYLAQVPDLYILVVFAKLMIFQWPLYFLFLDNNDVKSFFKCSGNKNDPLSDSTIQMNFHQMFDPKWQNSFTYARSPSTCAPPD